ncbi:hypothetical protein CTRI78_v007032 [Colletotrichum trifolii]|uniref:Uncharacterized protein n=1 Tax=Colletotrichum trifolii TaxID=5466 RepID=A0A4R8RAN4_COLTR|nr:hypothetical protein CTRI78_v007032 [Colletotrichum trifolii]
MWRVFPAHDSFKISLHQNPASSTLQKRRFDKIRLVSQMNIYSRNKTLKAFPAFVQHQRLRSDFEFAWLCPKADLAVFTAATRVPTLAAAPTDKASFLRNLESLKQTLCDDDSFFLKGRGETEDLLWVMPNLKLMRMWTIHNSVDRPAVPHSHAETIAIDRMAFFMLSCWIQREDSSINLVFDRGIRVLIHTGFAPEYLLGELFRTEEGFGMRFANTEFKCYKP